MTVAGQAPSYVVTGAASGIGRAVVDEVIETVPGALVTALDNSAEGLRELAERHSHAHAVVCDVTDPAALRDAVGEAAQRGRLVGLVNAAGNSATQPSLELTRADLHQVFAVHFEAALFASQAAAEAMRAHGEGGSIVNFSSVAEWFAWPRRLPYAVAKAAVSAMTRTLAVEWAVDGIRVNAVAPGYVNTPMIISLAAANAFDVEQRIGMHALGRFAEPREIAAVVAFLLSPRSSFMTGETVKVDGGFAVKR